MVRTMKSVVKQALTEWISGILIGSVPLLTHGLAYLVAKPPAGWDHVLTAELLFVSLGNLGTSVFLTIQRLVKRRYNFHDQGSLFTVVIALNILLLFLSGVLCGLVMSGQENEFTCPIAIVFLVLSATFSLIVELSLATKMIHRR